MELHHIRDLEIEAPLASGHAFLSAASGMVVTGNRLCVVADDAHCLAVFRLDDRRPGTLVQLVKGDLPRDALARKRFKPDFELLVALDGDSGSRLLALGSGSTSQRMRGAMIEFDEADTRPRVRLIDLRSLFAAIEPLVPGINIEGAVVEGERLVLFNRGHLRSPASQVVDVPLAAVLEGGPVTARLCAELTLPSLASVPLTATDACRLENGNFLIAAVAEATADSYADGALAGAAIVEIDPEFNLLAVNALDPPLKIEGIAAARTASGPRLFCVTDADDPDQPSALYTGTFGTAR